MIHQDQNFLTRKQPRLCVLPSSLQKRAAGDQITQKRRQHWQASKRSGLAQVSRNSSRRERLVLAVSRHWASRIFSPLNGRYWEKRSLDSCAAWTISKVGSLATNTACRLRVWVSAYAGAKIILRLRSRIGNDRFRPKSDVQIGGFSTAPPSPAKIPNLGATGSTNCDSNWRRFSKVRAPDQMKATS